MNPTVFNTFHSNTLHVILLVLSKYILYNLCVIEYIYINPINWMKTTVDNPTKYIWVYMHHSPYAATIYVIEIPTQYCKNGNSSNAFRFFRTEFFM